MKRTPYLPSLAVLPLVALACTAPTVGGGGPPDESAAWSDSLLVTTGPVGSYDLLGQCLPQTPTLDGAGAPACVVVEARHTGGSCACDAAARQPVSDAHASVIAMLEQEPAAAEVAPDCFCEIPLLAGAQANACATDTAGAPQLDGQPVDGVCYIDGTVSPAIGNAEITAPCPTTEKRLLRFVGAGVPAPSSSPETVMLFMTCETGGS